MRLGSIISALLHAGLLIVLIVGLPSAFEPGDIPTAIPVELLTISDITNIEAKVEEQPEPPQDEPEPPQQIAEIERPEVDSRPEPEPEEAEVVATDEPEEVVEPEPEPEEQKVVAAPPPKPIPNVRPRSKPEPPKKKDDFDLDQISALLDKKDDPEVRRDPREVPPREEEQDLPDQGAGLQTGLSLSEIDAFRVQMRRCWTVPAGAAYSEDLVVTIRVYLNQDGTLSRSPELLRDTRFNLATNSFYRTAAESAVRAIQRCQPFLMPRAKYSSWRELELTFDPRDMLGR